MDVESLQDMRVDDQDFEDGGLGEDDDAVKELYDPAQDPNERRVVRRAYRDLSKLLRESGQDYLQPNSDGIRDIFLQAERLFKRVKQTSDAILDSRLLVAAADLTVQKATRLEFGNVTARIDVDEFVGKSITFMRNNGQKERHSNEEQARLDVNSLNWARLGKAAFKENKRPAACDFLLGPLSIIKMNRVTKPRRAPLEKNWNKVIRPKESSGTDVHRTENKTIKLVKMLYGIVKHYWMENPEAEAHGLNLFKFVMNPQSFGQTVENIFYLSFLVKDGHIALSIKDDIPILHLTEPLEASDRGVFAPSWNQVIFPITMWHWKEIIKVFEIKEPMIPTRAVESEAVDGNGWYV
ncbi:hypothetical protein RUND412_006200 [Rhizina undulata]